MITSRRGASVITLSRPQYSNPCDLFCKHVITSAQKCWTRRRICGEAQFNLGLPYSSRRESQKPRPVLSQQKG